MHPNEYQQLAARTLIDEPDSTYTYRQISAVLTALDLLVAVGKYVDYLKKGIFHQHGVNDIAVEEMLHEIEYQLAEVGNSASYIHDESKRKHHLTPQQIMLLWNLTGVGAEPTEAIEYITNCIDGNTLIDNDIVIKEFGDCEWYNNATMTKLDIKFEDVLVENIEKLKKRYKDGYNSEASKVKGELL